MLNNRKADILWKWIPHVSINYVFLLTKFNFGRLAFIAVNNYIATAHFHSFYLVLVKWNVSFNLGVAEIRETTQ